MGGDNGPIEFVRGAVLAVEELDVDIILVGKEEELKKLLKKVKSKDKKWIDSIHHKF